MDRFAAQPLKGIRVVEVAQNIAGPYAGEILSALGADVVKVERPGTGDDARGWGPPFWRGTATTFQARSGRAGLSDLWHSGAALAMGLVGV